MSAPDPQDVRDADDLTALLRSSLKGRGVQFRTPEIAPDPDPASCLSGFMEFAAIPVSSSRGVVDEDVVQLEASPVGGGVDPTGMHRPPGPFRATFSRRITVADEDGEALQIHETTLELYFDERALDLGRTMLVAAGASAPPDEPSGSYSPYDGTLDEIAALFSAGGTGRLLALPTPQGMLAASELYDAG